MMKLFTCLQYRRISMVVLSISLLCFAAPAFATGEQKAAGERARAVIGGKGPDVLVLSVHGFKNLQTNRLEVPNNPMIYDVDGTALDLKSLKIPCEGYVEYKMVEGRDPQLFRLEIDGYGDDAKSLFTEQKPSKKVPE